MAIVNTIVALLFTVAAAKKEDGHLAASESCTSRPEEIVWSSRAECCSKACAGCCSLVCQICQGS